MSKISKSLRVLAKLPLNLLRQAAAIAAFFCVYSGVATSALAQTWNLAWSDEFNGAAGSVPDSSKWNYDTGAGGWGNGELQYYCSPTSAQPCNPGNPNISLDGNGNLVIKAIKDSSGNWTSGRMKTSGKFQVQYGRIEARMKLPVGAGVWPAFWMLGANIGTVSWPACGEQDIMEWVPQYTPSTTSSHIHGPGYSGANGIGSNSTFPNGGAVTDAGYHVYGVIWSANKIQFYRDDYTKPFLTLTPSSIPAGTQWVYNQPFFLLLNLAIGGGFPGNPNSSTPNPAVLLVDWVRVYQQQDSVVAPFFSPGGGTFSSAQNVSITSATSGASIRFTTNGSSPSTTAGTLYSGPVNIGTTSTLKALAFKTGLANSSITSATYTINGRTLTGSSADGFHALAIAPARTGTFTATFDAVPSASPENAVVGLSKGAATAYGSLSCIARFNPSGNIDAYNGTAYAAASAIHYSAGVSYHFRIVVNVTAQTYSVFVTPAGGAELTVGSNFAFRVAQTSLDTWNLDLNATPAGASLTARNLTP